MGISIQFRRGTADEHATFDGAAGEITVQDNSGETNTAWDLRVHDGDNASGYLIPSATSVAKLTNKILESVKLTVNISDNSGNLIATVTDGVLVFESGAITLDAPTIVDQTVTVPIEQMVARIARKNQMILGD